MYIHEIIKIFYRELYPKYKRIQTITLLQSHSKNTKKEKKKKEYRFLMINILTF